MYSTFTDTKFLSGVTYGGTVLDDIGGQFAGPLLDITFQDPTRSLSRYAPCICRNRRRHAPGRAFLFFLKKEKLFAQSIRFAYYFLLFADARVCTTKSRYTLCV